ncbi:MAG: hypothetical protein HY000_03205, partial [Planctomycetes bacterium]|nr:hypothetical protein [Planctomycetota bacterium]
MPRQWPSPEQSAIQSPRTWPIDGFKLSYVLENQSYFDRLTFSTWYNRTRFEGNAQNSGKRRQIPELDFLGFIGFTDVDAMSAGYRLASTWGETGDPQLTLGVDLRFLKEGSAAGRSVGRAGGALANGARDSCRTHRPNRHDGRRRGAPKISVSRKENPGPYRAL